ncbi:hypothetical protein GIB67_029124 [Kingdonia uniflora]|uniref:Uncharacterized protein n=1 Tax=Kingdonia uniflora TaxID=39325 RepID=A0A7J7MTL3_9MAGN|nr:hypothetical protein GIB67_038333 [Kingdonia uniflora]KAF6158261.1 hypothetical protein GIB67_029124 [Kingdonia uniflora]
MIKVSQRFWVSNTKMKQERLDQLAAVNQTGGKRGRIAELDNQRGKKQKIDHITMQKCIGAISILNEKQSGPTSRTFSAVVCEEGLATISYDGQLSPEKALRAAKLKSRFADTIRKAQQRTLLSNERLEKEKEQCEERARLEAQIRSIQAAQMREEAELKMKREREREAARVTLQKIEKTVQFEENLEILKELETLAGCKCLICFSSPVGGAQDMFGGSFCSPLERLGLILKDDYIEEEDGDVFPKASYNEDLEEGEICS